MSAQQQQQPAPPPGSAPSQLTRSRTRSAWLFLAPMLVVLAMVAVWPLVRTIYFGFTDANLSELEASRFVGLDNYLRYDEKRDRWYGLLVDADWRLAIWNTLKFAVISVAIETSLGMVIALVLNASFRLRGLVRAAVLIPWAVPTIVSAQMWSWMLHDQFGIVNDAFMKLGLISESYAWTSDPQLSMLSVILVDVWKTTPFMALLLLAALQMLPKSCYEAAKVDGIHPVKVFFRVTLPLIRPALMVAIIFRFLDALRIFDLIYVLTSNSKDTMTMSMYVRRELINNQEVGYGSAAATLLFVLVGLCTLAYIRLGRVRLGEDAR